MGDPAGAAAHVRQSIKPDDAWQTRLSFAVNALRRLFADEGFVALVRAEAMHTVPQHLAEQLELSEA